MKIYHTLNVSLAFQNCGSVWLMILRGSQEEIEQTFNGLWNLKATNGELDFTTHDKTVAKFWSTPSKMRDFFFNRHYLMFSNKHKAKDYAGAQMSELARHSHIFHDFVSVSLADVCNIGSTTAERPDNDFKDAVLIHAHTEKVVAKPEIVE